MKTIGLIGGMSWESTANYYKAINEGVKAQLGGLHSAKICLYSVDFDEIEKHQHLGQWQQTGEILGNAAQAIASAGADFFLICTNTMHKVADQVSAQVDIPIVHIADATAEQLLADGITKVGLLGTRFTMEQDFYRGRLSKTFGVDVIVPALADREIVHHIIYHELCLGQIMPSSREEYLRIITQLAEQGAQAIILGCTEIAMLINQSHTKIPLYDTTAIHAQKAVTLALCDSQMSD